MKTKSILSVIICLLLGGTAIGQSNPGITVYADENWSGPSKVITADWDAGSAPLWNDQISSIRIPPGYKIQIFEHGQFNGAFRILTNDWTIVSLRDFNDVISSIKILEYPASGITVFTDAQWQGNSMVITGDWDAGSTPGWNDVISSIRIPPGYKIQIFEHGFSGESRILISDWTVRSSTRQEFNDIISTIKILEYPSQIPPPVVIVKEEVKVVPTPPAPVAVVAGNCSLADKSFTDIQNAIKGKPFSDTKMSTAKLSIKGKCLSIDQIRILSKLFSYEDQKYEFITYAYDMTDNKSDYYSLSDAFTYSATVEDFNEFLEKKN